MSRPGFSLGALLLVVLSLGCTAECRKLEPLSEVREDVRERIDNWLDKVDVSDAQRARIHKLFEPLEPARVRFRQESVPLLHQLVTELRREGSDRQRAGALIVQMVDAGERYARVVADCSLNAQAVLSPEQRKQLALKAAEPSELFDGSWFLDRGLDLLMLRIGANSAQEQWVSRMKVHFVKRTRELQRKLDVRKAEAAAEFIKARPDAARVHAALHGARVEMERYALDVAGYHQLLVSKLEPKQRSLLGAELVRVEVCPDSATAGTAKGGRSPS